MSELENLIKALQKPKYSFDDCLKFINESGKKYGLELKEINGQFNFVKHITE